MENTSTITLGGTEQTVAPLRPLQAAAFLDDVETNSQTDTRVKVFTRSLRTICIGMANANNDLIKDQTEENAIDKINLLATYEEITPAFRTVLEITGLRKAEPAAASSTTSEKPSSNT